MKVSGTGIGGVSQSVKISKGLIDAAREEAAIMDRSITQQIEYWAKLGRAAERLAPKKRKRARR